MAQDIFEIKQELVYWLRNADIISTSNRGVTTSQDTGTFSAAATHTLTTNPTLIKNIRDITVGGTPLALYTDYTLNRSTGVITFIAAQTGAYTINYDQGNTDSLFTDFPQDNLPLSAFPRVAIEIIDKIINVEDLGAVTTHHAYMLTIVAYAKGNEAVDDMISAIEASINGNGKNFIQTKFIVSKAMGPMLNSPNKSNKILQRNLDFQTKFNYETS